MEPPDRLRARIERDLGWLSAAWRPAPGGGLTRAGRWLAEGPEGETVFVKAGLDDHSRDSVRNEIRVYREVSGQFMPELLGWDRGDPPHLLLEDLSGARWPPPYPDDVQPLFDALARVHEITAPPTLPRLKRATLWPRLRAGAGDPWITAHAARLEEAELRADPAGDRLLHADLWSPNLCFAARGAILVDWGDARAGNPLVDLAMASADLRRHGRRPPAGLLDDEPAWASFVLAQASGYLLQDRGWAADPGRVEELDRQFFQAGLDWAREVFD